LIKNIYQNGILYPSKELVKKVTKEEFNPKYYIEHLKNKYAPNKK
jgi:Zn-dependent M32 family carboxypeptidase